MLEAIFGILLLLLSAIVPALCQDGHLLGIDPDIADEFIMPYYKIETKVVAECAGRTTTITPAFFEVVTISKAKQQLTQKPFNFINVNRLNLRGIERDEQGRPTRGIWIYFVNADGQPQRNWTPTNRRCCRAVASASIRLGLTEAFVGASAVWGMKMKCGGEGSDPSCAIRDVKCAITQWSVQQVIEPVEYRPITNSIRFAAGASASCPIASEGGFVRPQEYYTDTNAREAGFFTLVVFGVQSPTGHYYKDFALFDASNVFQSVQSAEDRSTRTVTVAIVMRGSGLAQSAWPEADRPCCMPNFVVEITLGIIENSYIIHRRTDDRGLFVACPPSLYSRATPACAKEYPDSGETYCERTIYSIYQVPLDEGHQNS